MTPAARDIDKIPGLRNAPVEKGEVLYVCDICDFSSADPMKAKAHLRESNQYVQSKWWNHELRLVLEVNVNEQ